MSDDVSRELDQLLRDREKYENWLRRLESERSKATAEAYSRVRGDYQQRLDEVVSKLQGHSEAVQGRLHELEQKVVDLEGERALRAEKLDEARLRRSVGEFRDDNEWADQEKRLASSVQKTDQELTRARTEIDRLRDIVGQVRSAEARPAAAPRPAPAAPRPTPPREAAPAPPPQPEPVAEGGFLSLEELVLEDKDVVIEEPAPAEPLAAEPGVGDELAFLESLSLGGSEDGDSFSFLEQHGSGTPQTIICPHCAAANDPAEWYCTECGEELPAE
jgi:gas vesicle protein